MQIYNGQFFSIPLVAHAQGAAHKSEKWKNIVSSCPVVKNLPDNSLITIITFDTELNGCLTKQLEQSGIPYINAARGVKGWENRYKIPLLVDACKLVKTPYILCLDAGDILLAEDLNTLVSRFEATGLDILYNAGKFNYPTLTNMHETTKSAFRYLNAGAFIGKTHIIEHFYKFIFDKEYHTDHGKYHFSEQLRVRRAREEYSYNKGIQVDVECGIFQTLNGTRYDFTGDLLSIIQ